MFGFKLKFPFRITGISTLWGGLSWEYCDSSKESKGKEITLDSNSKIFVFISSKCQPEKYKNIRAVLKQQYSGTLVKTKIDKFLNVSGSRHCSIEQQCREVALCWRDVPDG